MAGSAFIQPKWRKPSPLGYGNAIDSVGSVASPLLAGFSLASVIVVSDDTGNFKWPGAVIFTLAIAAVLLIGAVQCAFNARQNLWSGGEVREWWPDMKEDSEREQLLREQQADAFHQWEVWASRTRIAYDSGTIALLVGIGLAILPPQDVGLQSGLRWFAAGVTFAACAAQVFWISAQSRQRHL